jgi:hypothetical protein
MGSYMVIFEARVLFLVEKSPNLRIVSCLHDNFSKFLNNILHVACNYVSSSNEGRHIVLV